MALTRDSIGDPVADRAIRSFHREMDQIVRDFFKDFAAFGKGSRGGQQTDADNTWIPNVDVRDSGREYYVTVDLPGVPKDKVKVDVCGVSLIFSGERPHNGQENQRGIYSERPKGRFTRTIPLPTGVQADKVEAKFEDGVLQVKVPRSEESIALVFLDINNGCVFASDFTPAPRAGHVAILVDQKIVFVGGKLDNVTNSREIFYLDLQNGLNLSSSNSSGLEFGTFNETIPSEIGGISLAASAAGITNNLPMIEIFGGLTIVDQRDIKNGTNSTYPKSINSFFSINIQNTTNSISIKVLNDTIPNRPSSRYRVNSVMDKYSRFYVFGGSNSVNDTKMYVYDYWKEAWTSVQSVNAPTPISGYSATLLPNGQIFYIGVFNTNNSQWNFLNATSEKTIPRRFGHTGTLSSDGRNIFIFGGLIGSDDMKLAGDIDIMSLAVLGIETLKWTRPIISNIELGPSKKLADHSAILYNDFLIFAFGYQNYILSNRIYILDVANETYQWVETITRLKGNITATHNPSKPTNSQPSDSQHVLPTWVIVLISLSVLMFIVFAVWGTLAFLKE
ncbi:12584_t:CDS:10, partial [Ambispora gerdemannii]